jgi:hypothetical protein
VQISTIQKIIEEALSKDNEKMSMNKDKGKNKVGEEDEHQKMGFSPIQ